MSRFAVFIIYGFSLLCIGFDFSGNRYSIKLKRQIFDFFCFILILGATLKPSDFCFDVNNYYMFFNKINPIYSYHYKFGEFEPAYSYLNSIVKTFTSNYHVLFFVLSFIDVMLYRRIILKYTDKIFLALFVFISSFFFLNEMIVLRFAVASALIFLNIENVKENKIWRFILISMIATAFHYSAVAAFLLPLIYKKEKREQNIKRIAFFIIICAIVFSLLSPMKMIALLGKAIPDLYDAVLWHLLRYTASESSAGIKRVILYIPYFYLAICYFFNATHNNLSKNEQSVSYAQILYIMMAILFMLVFNEVASMARINQLFLTSVILISANFTKVHRRYKWLSELYFLGIVVLQVYNFLRQNFFNSSGATYFN